MKKSTVLKKIFRERKFPELAGSHPGLAGKTGMHQSQAWLCQAPYVDLAVAIHPGKKPDLEVGIGSGIDTREWQVANDIAVLAMA